MLSRAETFYGKRNALLSQYKVSAPTSMLVYPNFH